MKAYVNHGRWVVDCSTPYCTGAALADPASGICTNCEQRYVAVFPDDRVLIDAALSRRIVPQTRNWLPGETVADLVRENTEHESEGVVV